MKTSIVLTGTYKIIYMVIKISRQRMSLLGN